MEEPKDLPKYKSHKVVQALKIKEVYTGMTSNSMFGTDVGSITFEDNRYATFKVPRYYIEKHQPKAGGYYVRYDDGYESYSPAKAFEDGYTLIEEYKEEEVDILTGLPTSDRPDTSADYQFAITDRVKVVENGFRCPNCGKHAGSTGDESTVIAKSFPNFIPEGNPHYTWEEVHVCPDCDTIYKIKNGT